METNYTRIYKDNTGSPLYTFCEEKHDCIKWLKTYGFHLVAASDLCDRKTTANSVKCQITLDITKYNVKLLVRAVQRAGMVFHINDSNYTIPQTVPMAAKAYSLSTEAPGKSEFIVDKSVCCITIWSEIATPVRFGKVKDACLKQLESDEFLIQHVNSNEVTGPMSYDTALGVMNGTSSLKMLPIKKKHLLTTYVGSYKAHNVRSVTPVAFNIPKIDMTGIPIPKNHYATGRALMNGDISGQHSVMVLYANGFILQTQHELEIDFDPIEFLSSTEISKINMISFTCRSYGTDKKKEFSTTRWVYDDKLGFPPVAIVEYFPDERLEFGTPTDRNVSCPDSALVGLGENAVRDFFGSKEAGSILVQLFSAGLMKVFYYDREQPDFEKRDNKFSDIGVYHKYITNVAPSITFNSLYKQVAHEAENLKFRFEL